MKSNKNKKIKTISTIGIVGGAIVLPFITNDTLASSIDRNNSEKLINKDFAKKEKLNLSKENAASNEKLDVSIIFSSCIPPIMDTDFPTRDDIIKEIINCNPEMVNLFWDQLDVTYNGDGTSHISALIDAQNYFGECNICLSTKIIATPTDAKLINVGDSVVISAKLSGLWKTAYSWHYMIDSKILHYLNIVENHNSETIVFTLKKSLDGESYNFDIGLTILGIANSNVINIKIDGDQNISYFIFNGSTIVGLTNAGQQQRNLIIPDTIYGIEINSIAARAFEYNTNLQNISLPKFLNIVGNLAFHGCKNLEEITINNQNTFFDTNSIDTKTKTTLKISDSALGWIASGLTRLNINNQSIPKFQYSYKNGLINSWANLDNTSSKPIICNASFDVAESISSETDLKAYCTTQIIISATIPSSSLQQSIDNHLVGVFTDTTKSIPWFKKYSSGDQTQYWGAGQATRTDYEFYGYKVYGYKNIGIRGDNSICNFLSQANTEYFDYGKPAWTDTDSNGRDFCKIYFNSVYANQAGEPISNYVTGSTWWHTQEIDVNGNTSWDGYEHISGNPRISDGQSDIFNW